MVGIGHPDRWYYSNFENFVERNYSGQIKKMALEAKGRELISTLPEQIPAFDHLCIAAVKLDELLHGIRKTPLSSEKSEAVKKLSQETRNFLAEIASNKPPGSLRDRVVSLKNYLPSSISNGYKKIILLVRWVIGKIFLQKNLEGAQPASSYWFSPFDYKAGKDLKRVWEKTKQDLDSGYYTLNGKRVDLKLSDSTRNTYKRSAQYCWWGYFRKDGDGRIPQVVNRDAIETVVNEKKQGFNPVLLNLANADFPGGGYKRGAAAFEEEICRRSGLAHAIDFNHGKVKNFYPLKSSELLYSPNVPIFRNGAKKQYSYMEKPTYVSVITSAAINRNNDSDKIFEDHKKFSSEMECRIYAQLAAAKENGHDSIVLTAFGCGAFGCDPTEVAALYKKVLKTYFEGVFDRVIFSIVEDENSNCSHNPEGNLKPFKEVFKINNY